MMSGREDVIMRAECGGSELRPRAQPLRPMPAPGLAGCVTLGKLLAPSVSSSAS